MTKQTKNPVFAFFSSVQLALFLLIFLAGTSIIGTIIPQNSPGAFYIKQYGPQMAQFMELLHLTDMYNAWWFLLLLVLFAINLIVCSLERIPRVLKIIRQDNLDTSLERLKKMPLQKSVRGSDNVETAQTEVSTLLQAAGWRPRQRATENGVLFFAEKGAWTRFGVYIVHLSILVVLLGAVVGSAMIAQNVLKKPSFAFKGSIMLPETREASAIYSFRDNQPIDLGFSIRCDYFTIEYYENGMPKTYLSKVTVVEDGQEMLSTDIEVNTPLTYKGVTFYQSSYQPYQDFVISVAHEQSAKNTTMLVQPEKQAAWADGGVSFGIINQEARRNVIQRVKVWFTDNQGAPSTFWVNAGQEARVERPSGTYLFSAKQLYATGLQVTKDPGVWLVYGGCIMMLAGLYIAFFMSHKKVFVFIEKNKKETTILFTGTANKNKIGFEKQFTALTDGFPSAHQQ